MRSVSFVENLKVDVSDNLFNEALLLADVDNDGDNELIVGQVNGDLSIFKGSGSKPWRTCSRLGMIACVAVGDLWNQGENLLVCVTAEGWCHLFNVTCKRSDEKLEPISSQRLPTNCRIILIADVDGDGLLELVTGHADRVVHIHRLEAVSGEQNTSKLQSTNDSPSVDTTPEKAGNRGSVIAEEEISSSPQPRQPDTQDTPKQCARDQDIEPPKTSAPRDEKQKKQDLKSGDEIKNHKDPKCAIPGAFALQFVSIKNWMLSCQIGSLVVFDVMTMRHLLASQPGGTYRILMSSELSHTDKVSLVDSEQYSSSPSSASIFNQLPVLGGRNQGLPTNLISVRSQGTVSSVSSMHSSVKDQADLALCTPDGNLMLLNGNKLHWSYHVEHGSFNLFSLSKLDITCDGSEEIAVCALDGNTYIIDRYKNVVQFKFGENVMAFCAGHFAYTPGKNLPCLVYVSFSNHLVMYWNARLSSMVPRNLTMKMKNRAFQSKDVANALSGVTGNNSENNNEHSEFYKQCLYEKRR